MLADTVRTMAEQAGILINGSNPRDIRVKDDRLYARVLLEKSLGLGESYMDGWWDCEQLDEMVCRLLLGGLARYAAEQHGCTVTAVNISQEQLRYARDFCRGLPVHFQDCDYRAVTGQFDKIVSVGMFEHVGCKNYRTFMNVVHRCLRRRGLFLLHIVGGTESQMSCDPWLTKYIFPNSMLPSIAQMAKAAEALFGPEASTCGRWS